MNLLQIESFLAIVESGSITEAAEELYISQSTLSSRLKALEEELGFVLITRGPGIKNNNLTKRGIEFLDYAYRFMAINKEIGYWKRSEDIDRIRIGAPQTLNISFFKNLYKTISQESSIHLSISSHWNETIYKLVNSGDLDLGIVTRPFQSSRLNTLHIFNEALLVVYDKRYAGYQKLDELARQNQIYMPLGPNYDSWQKKHWDVFEQAKVSLDSPHLMASYLETEGSWAVVPLCLYQLMKKRNPHIHLLEHDDPVYRELYLIHPIEASESQQSNLDKMIDWIIDFVQKADQEGLCQATDIEK